METVNPLQSPEAEFEYIDVSSVSNQRFSIQATQRLRGKDAPSRARRLVRARDVLFATVRPTLQRIAVVPDELDRQVCSTGFYVLRPKPEVDHRFLFYSLFTEEFTGRMESLQTGASYPAVTDGQVRAQRLLLPPLPEQQRIVRILDEVFDGIAAVKANAEKNIHNARVLYETYVETVFGSHEDEPGSYDSLANLCELVVDCEHRTAPIQEDGIASIRTANIGRGRLLLEGVCRVSEETYREWTRRAVPVPGDLILAREAPAGNVAVIPENPKVCLGQRTVLIRPRRGLLEPEFLAFMLLRASTQRKLLAHSRGATVEHVNMKDIRALRIGPIPPLPVQQKMVLAATDARQQCEQLESIYQQKLVALEGLKKSLLNQAFSGDL